MTVSYGDENVKTILRIYLQCCNECVMNY